MHDRRLYLVATAAELDRVLEPALAGGVDVVQVREKDADDDVVTRAVERFAPLCAAAGALLIVNDRPDLVGAADGVHVGQDDVSSREARRVAREGAIVGRSTHTRDQADAAEAAGLDYLCVGPVWETPTKPGRPAAGLALVRHAARSGYRTPWWAIGGIDEVNVQQVARAGAQRVVVVRAITQAADPERVARQLLHVLREHSGVA